MRKVILYSTSVIVFFGIVWFLLFSLHITLVPNYSYSKLYSVIDTIITHHPQRHISEQMIIEEDRYIKDREITGEDIGIVVRNGAKVTLKNVHIHHNKKGIYVESGGELKIVDSIVEKNAEEGIDIREFTKVFIRNNYIRENGESGIEMESEHVRAIVLGNVIIDNEAKGITMQYRKGDGGKAYIFWNHVINNIEYDLMCDNTTGKNPTPKGFFCDFMSIYGNFGSIKGCKWSDCKKMIIAL